MYEDSKDEAQDHAEHSHTFAESYGTIDKLKNICIGVYIDMCINMHAHAHR